MIYVIRNNQYSGEQFLDSEEVCAEYIAQGCTAVMFDSVPAFHDRWVNTPASENSSEIVITLTLDEAKTVKLAQLKAITKKFTVNDCEAMYLTSSLGYTINADKTAQDNISGLITGHDASDIIKYKVYDNSFKDVTIDDLTLMLKECAQNGESLYAQKFAYQQQIAACTSIEELQTIEFSFIMMDFSTE